MYCLGMRDDSIKFLTNLINDQIGALSALKSQMLRDPLKYNLYAAENLAETNAKIAEQLAKIKLLNDILKKSEKA